MLQIADIDPLIADNFVGVRIKKRIADVDNGESLTQTRLNPPDVNVHTGTSDKVAFTGP